MLAFLVRNWRLKLLALALAIVAWVGVVYAANPPGEKTISVPVPQPPAVSLPNGYVLTSDIRDIAVVVAGAQNHLNSFNASSLQVTANYRVISAVGNSVPANVSVPVVVTSLDPNVQIASYPTTVQAPVDRLGSTVAPVQLNISKQLAPGLVASNPTIKPDSVTLRGPEHELQSAVVKTDAIDLSNQAANYTATLNVNAYDPNGHKLNDVNASPANVTVSITVTEPNTTRTTSLVLGPIRGIPAGYAVSAISYTPMTVTLTGPQPDLNQASLATVTTGAIDLGGRTGINSYTVGIPAPAADVSVSPTTVRVTVTVKLIPTPTAAPTPTPTPTSSPGPTP